MPFKQFIPKRIKPLDVFAFADALGLNSSQFRSCFNGNKFAQMLNDGLQQGKQAQIGGTPSFLINGSLIEGALPFTDFQTKIEAALAAAGVQ